MGGKKNTSNCPIYYSAIHCESSLAAILCLLHNSQDRDNLPLRQIFKVCHVLPPHTSHFPQLNLTCDRCDLIQINTTDDSYGTVHTYNISVSKFCCPVCWELLNVLNETNDNLKFIVSAHHSNLYPACLPTWRSDRALEGMIEVFRKKLYEKLCQLPSPSVVNPSLSAPQSSGHYRSLSLESAGESISSEDHL